MKFRHFHIQPNLPEPLLPLKDLAMNLWFCWNWEAVQLFIRLDPDLWEKSYQNPVLMLGALSQNDLESAASDESFVANLRDVHARFIDYLKAPGWFRETYAAEKDFLAAYFSCEFGIDEGLPIYSGGLGVLAGDHLKSASDLGIPLVGVGLLYQKGYFRQVLNQDGWQQEQYPVNDWFNMPVTIERGPDGKALTVDVEMGGETVNVRIWRVQVGRTPLYLLDTNVKTNSPAAREITETLYGGDREMRIRQEIILGVGGVRALKALGLSPTVYHMNEGHSAFLALERIRAVVAERGISFAEAGEQVYGSTVFTTHTPVPAGNEVFAAELVLKYFQPMAQQLGLSWQKFLRMGQAPGEKSHQFGLTILALKTAAFVNGVARLHGETSRKMWQHLWPGLPESEVPIGCITNGIHTRSWISHEMGDLFSRYLGPRFSVKPADHSVWERIDTVPSSELWGRHETRRERLVFFARKRIRTQLLRQGAGASALRAAEELLSPEALTIGVARRFATYKRAWLLFRQPERLVRLLTNPDRPVQILFAGKAHPQDQAGKEVIKAVIHFARDPRIRHRIAFLEDYDINVARYLTQGVDVWLNTPRRPHEASGTSGMKAAANGALNVSILDGWWCEGYAPDTGWAIGSGEVYADPEEQDQVEGEALYSLLEEEIVPLFYDRDRAGLPRGWIALMKSSMGKLGAYFNTHRMVQEYLEKLYLPAHRAGHHLGEDDFAAAKALASWRRVRTAWPRVSVHFEEAPGGPEYKADGVAPVVIRAELGPLSPEDVAVEIVHGPMGSSGEPLWREIVRAGLVGTDGKVATFSAEIPCRASGRYGYAARVVPRHPDLVNPCIPLLVTWE
ncbi:MAG: alpha-glucan phosphorylase [Deltaproteobacteria bacterium GWC2_65_14]|nr:MAG: alpha-glucan phosphorylase [Deltaproteobacteria bacterium GWC2_65_14]